NALPDNTNPELWPTFLYKVTVKITDINGETHEFEQQVNAAYRDALIHATIPEDGDKNNLNNITTKITNVNNIAIDNSYKIVVSKLDAPKQILKSRLWEKPDQFLYDEATFKSFFPNDEYKNEQDKEAWKPLTASFTKTYKGTQQIDLIAENAITKNGWYLIEITTQDTKGQEVKQKYYTHAVINKDMPIEKA